MGNPQVFIIGDSISIHYNPYLKQSLGNLADCIRKGDLPGEDSLDPNGRDSNQVVKYIHHLIETHFKTDILIVNCGLHDIKQDPLSGRRQVEPETFHANLCQLILLYPQLSRKLIWVTITPVDDAIHNSRNREFNRFNADVVRYNQIAHDVMQPAGISIIDLYQFTAHLESPETLYEDHVHFREEVRMLQGTFLAGCLSFLIQ